MLYCRAVSYDQPCAYCDKKIPAYKGHYADVIDEKTYHEGDPASANVIVSHYECRRGLA
jgi:hypothetical protein